MTFEVICNVCSKKHYPKTLMRPLLCCSSARGVRRLIGAFADSETGQRWFTVMKIATLRIVRGRRMAKAKAR